MNSLQALEFTDLAVARHLEDCWFKATADSVQLSAIPLGCAAEMAKLWTALNRQTGKSDFKIDWPDAGGMRLRVKRNRVDSQESVFICRRYTAQARSLAELGFAGPVSSRLLAPTLTDGLIVIFGKTTAAVSIVRERLRLYGGVCWTVENPIEIPFQGRHGKGVCYQIEVDSDDAIGAAICDLYRSTPNIILIGELRFGHAVREAISAASSGHLVLATMHADNLIHGLARLTRIAGEDSATFALSDALQVGLHLLLNHNTGQPNLAVETLWMNGDVEDGLKSIIREGDFHLLKSEMERQKRNILSQRKLP